MLSKTDIRTFQKRTQLFLSVVLLFIVIGLISGYIYIGMYVAKQEVVPSIVAPMVENKQQNPEDQQKNIVQALHNNSSPGGAVNQAEQTAVINELAKNAGKVPEEVDQQVIIKSLTDNSK